MRKSKAEKNHCKDFTERGYREALKLAKLNYNFINYDEYRKAGKNLLWRHDVDVSVNRACRLAQIDAEEGIRSTFFIHLHSDYYNALEPEISELTKKIVGLGRELGLHFDPGFYKLNPRDRKRIAYFLKMERNLLERILEKKIKVFSFHLPEIGNWLTISQEKISGMVNAYSGFFRKNYGYCSDSGGYWRFRRLKDVLTEAKDKKLQVLTHPEWWTPTAISSRDRISRCIEGAAAKRHRKYDEALRKMGRKNVK